MNKEKQGWLGEEYESSAEMTVNTGGSHLSAVQFIAQGKSVGLTTALELDIKFKFPFVSLR
jgi:hypothetical protein